MADSEIADLINAVKEHRKFKQLACYSIQVYLLSQQPKLSWTAFGFRMRVSAPRVLSLRPPPPPPPTLPTPLPTHRDLHHHLLKALEKSIEHSNVRWRENIELAISLDAADVVCDILKRHQGHTPSGRASD